MLSPEMVRSSRGDEGLHGRWSWTTQTGAAERTPVLHNG